MSTGTQNRFGIASLLLLAVAFVAAVIVSNQLLKGVRIDLTESRLYTLSDGTRRILAGIDDPVNLYFYFSDQASEGLPSLRDYAGRVRELLQEFENAGGGIRLKIIDPLPFSEEEDQATRFGLQGVGLATTTDPVYFGLAGTNSVGDEEIIPFFQPDREATLEYDIARLVSTLANPERTLVGLVTGLPLAGRFDPQTQRMQPAWVVYQQAQQLFEVRDLGTSFESVPEDVGLLWIVQPKDLSPGTQYAIDQFVMRGGRAVIFVDPVAAIDAEPQPGMPPGMPAPPGSSDLPLLFDGWGIDYDPQQVVADARLALPISAGFGNRPVRHYGYLGITPEFMSTDDVVTMELGAVNAAMPGELAVKADAGITLEPLLSASPASATLPASRFSFLPDPTTLQDGFSPGGEALLIAARIGGTLPSAFPDGAPADTVDTGEPDAGAGPAEPPAHLGESAQPANLIVVADVDLLSDPLWVQTQSFFGQQIANAFAGNGALVVNALENLAGSADLIAVRSRGSFSRPFTTVDALRAQAEARFRATEERLQQELAETERRLGELQSAREDTGSLLLTPEQQAEIDRFTEQRASIRRELRAVQRGLDEDIENLGTTLKVLNIGLVPVLLTLVALIAIWRRRRREAA